MAAATLELDEIQGNILAGFKSDFAGFLLFTLSGEAQMARAWLADVIADVSTTDEVQTFNDLFRLRRSLGEELPQASWMNLALTQSGLRALGVGETDLDQMPQEFQQGMRARAELIGDTGNNAPESWPNGLGSASIHALMIIAADDAGERNAKVVEYVRRARAHGATCVLSQSGRKRRDMPGYEHFGYRDGISQPAVAGFDGPPKPGQVQPGEFVLGYPREPETGNAPAVVESDSNPSWLANGSFLVFRRLRQDVRAFDEFVRDAAGDPANEELFRAKVVGRYRSGAPLMSPGNASEDQTVAGAGAAAADPNDFTYGGDPSGDVVPRAAHIRKTYPRDQPLPGDNAQRRRILRRGIPFGEPYASTAPADSHNGATAERGLCFVCYQRSIADQFEHVQREWMNTDSYPEANDGIDPVSAAEANRYWRMSAADTPIELATWVWTTAGEYFFAPSIAAMKQFARVG